MSYVAKAGHPKGGGRRSSKAGPAAKASCLFCSLGRTKSGPRKLVLARTSDVLVVLNRYPYNVGHVMVAPRRHTASISKMTAEESLEVTWWLGRVERALRAAYRPHGFNFGMNVGRTAGAGVLGHLHWHVVPRWNGDTNFMPVTAAAKVLPEALDVTYRRLLDALRGGRPGRRRRR